MTLIVEVFKGVLFWGIIESVRALLKDRKKE